MIGVAAAGAADAAWLAEIHRQAFDDPWPTADLAVLIDSPGAFAFAALDDGAPVAFILCRIAADEAEILTLATAPSARRRGAAAALIQASRARAAEAGANHLFLEVAQDNLGAVALYSGKGFVEVGRRRSYYRRQTGAVDALLMRLDLNN